MGDNTHDDDRPVWQLSRDEQRVLLITFVGGLGAIVIGAAIIGLALALARAGRQGGEAWQAFLPFAFAAVLSTVVAVVLTRSKWFAWWSKSAPSL
jgi:hypothetical protein